MITDFRRSELGSNFKGKLFKLPLVTSRSPTGWLMQAMTDTFQCGMDTREITNMFPFSGYLWHNTPSIAMLYEFFALADMFVVMEEQQEVANHA